MAGGAVRRRCIDGGVFLLIIQFHSGQRGAELCRQGLRVGAFLIGIMVNSSLSSITSHHAHHARRGGRLRHRAAEHRAAMAGGGRQRAHHSS